MSPFHEIATALELRLPQREGLTEAELLRALAAGIERMLERNPDGLFQVMYRLDVAEFVLAQSLASHNPGEALAEAVYRRQLQKAQSRAQTPPADDSDPELKW